jgi:hypothetical protein
MAFVTTNNYTKIEFSDRRAPLLDLVSERGMPMQRTKQV